jgi:hypothetical protein
LDSAENSIFEGLLKIDRQQTGCMRFCSLMDAPGSRTPRRYNCQPDLAEQALREADRWRTLSEDKRTAAVQRERERIRPRFKSTLYGTAAYCQLSEDCADEIVRGADDESELGVFHDLFNSQRKANLRTRLDEYTVAGMEAAIIFAT